jgi:putative acetyltransferase
MEAARRLYEAAGFTRLAGPMGDTGHHGCDRWYALEL